MCLGGTIRNYVSSFKQKQIRDREYSTGCTMIRGPIESIFELIYGHIYIVLIGIVNINWKVPKSPKYMRSYIFFCRKCYIPYFLKEKV